MTDYTYTQDIDCHAPQGHGSRNWNYEKITYTNGNGHAPQGHGSRNIRAFLFAPMLICHAPQGHGSRNIHDEGYEHYIIVMPRRGMGVEIFQQG